MFKNILFFSTLLIVSNAFSFGGNGQSLSTPGARTNGNSYRGLSPAAQSLLHGLDAIEAAGSINCNQSLTSAASCLACNCGNEVNPRESLEEKAKVTKVVLSRVKSSQYPNTICGVICDKSQFSWTLGTYNEQCQRTRRRNPRYFNHKSLSGNELKSCIASIKLAARDLMVERPNEIYALSYLNPEASSDRSWLNRCRRNQAEPRRGSHLFCTPYPVRENYVEIPASAIAYLEPF